MQGHIDYTADIDGVIFDPFEINGRHPSVEKIRIEATGEKVKIRFFVKGLASPEEAHRLTQNMVEEILDRMAFKLNVPIRSAQYSGGSIIEVKKSETNSIKLLSGQISGVLELKGELSKIHKLGPKSTENLKKDLEKEDLPGAQYFNLFRFALQSPDPVTRFMFLYSILLVMCGDSQKKVDKFIQKIDPNVEVTESPHDGKPETIYTRLRNEVAHRRKNAHPAKTRKEIEGILPRFTGLVRKAIELS